MDASRSNLCQEDVTELLSMLESSDAQTVESVKALIHENLNGTKDVWLLHGLVDYYIAFQSKHALEILVRVREPHDKHLFDKLTEYMKHESTRYQCLLLLSHLVHNQPPWLHKIAHHRIFQTLLTVLKSEKDSPSLLCALFITVCLLPMIPSQIGPYLSDIFEVFSRLVAWSIKNSIGVPEIYVLHLQVGVYALFHRLYGMYPCNFLGYLRSYYGRREYNEENICVFTNVIKPMLQRVRLHPLLVTACKETELSHKRWKRMAPHDVIVECANISLDAVEGAGEDIQPKNTTFISELSSQTYPLSNENSMHYVSFSSQSSTTSLTVESNSVVNDAMSQKVDVLWSPSLTCNVPTSNQILHASSELDSGVKRIFSDTSVAVDVDLLFNDDAEERNESYLVKNNADSAVTGNLMHQNKEICDSNSSEVYPAALALTSSNTNIAEALEAKEEELADKEVCELTSSSPNPDLQEHFENRHDTPFCSTTQNLTDKPIVPDIRSASVTKDKEEYSYEQVDVIAQEQSELKIEKFVRTMNRLRYFSQCGAPPDISTEPAKKPILLRCASCPDVFYSQSLLSTTEDNNDMNDQLNSHVVSDLSPIAPIVTSANSYCKNTSNASSPFVSSLPAVDTQYNHLIPIAMPSVSLSKNVSYSDKASNSVPCVHPVETSSSWGFTPAELLDRHILLSNEAYLGQLNSIPLTSTKCTNWTHFGGKPPPDEITMLQTQILLLHNQLMFERHRREIHAERNRRLLGKARRTRMQEEYTTALKDQVSLLERENDKLRKQISELHDLYGNVCQDKKNSDYNSSCTIKKLVQEKSNLQYSNKKLQALLVDQKQEIEAIKDEHKLDQSYITDLKFENELLKHDVASLSKTEKELIRLSKENTLLHELNQLYVDRLETSKEPIVPNDAVDLQKDAAYSEVKGLKQSLESKTLQIDIGLSRITELEIELSALKLRIIKQTEIAEHMKALHKDEVLAREDRLLSLRRIIHQNESHILELYNDLDQFKDEIRMLKGSLSVAGGSTDVSTAPSSSHCPADLIESVKEKDHFDSFLISVDN